MLGNRRSGEKFLKVDFDDENRHNANRDSNDNVMRPIAQLPLNNSNLV